MDDLTKDQAYQSLLNQISNIYEEGRQKYINMPMMGYWTIYYRI